MIDCQSTHDQCSWTQLISYVQYIQCMTRTRLTAHDS